MATPGPSKGGYDYEFVSGPPKQLECPVCLLTLRDVNVTSCCGNQYCQPCIGRIRNENKPCPLCNEPNFTTFLHKGIVREINSLKIRCPQRKLGCDWEGELGQVEQHLNPREGSTIKGCDFVVIECVNKCGVRLARMKIHNHQMEECPRRPVEVQLSSLARKLNAVIAENKAIEAEVQAIKAENKTIKSEFQAIKAENKAIKTEVQAIKAENKAIKAENRSLKQNVEHLQLSSRYVRYEVPPFYFTVINALSYKKTNYTWVSQPFYSHACGYKMMVLVHPNGFGEAKGTHLSLYVAIMRGEYDDKLSWPFMGRITFQVFNSKYDVWGNSICVNYLDGPIDVRKQPPKDEIRNTSLGFPKVFEHKDWNSFCNGPIDSIRFRISAVNL